MLMKLIAPVILNKGKAVNSLYDSTPFAGGDAVMLAEDYSNRGADAILIFDQSDSDEEHDEALTLVRQMARRTDIPMWGAGNVRRSEDVKKILYAGCRKAVLNFSKPSNMEMLEEVSKRFGREKLAVCVNAAAGEAPSDEELESIGRFAEDIIVLVQEGCPESAGGIASTAGDIKLNADMICIQPCSRDMSGTGTASASEPAVSEAVRSMWIYAREMGLSGIGGTFIQDRSADIMGMKALMKSDGLEANLFESSYSWDELKKNSDGLIPVVVQDYRNEEVLMVAYMNQEAFARTIRTGVMTYWSRSRQELWVKGLTSGHYQYLKELKVDCDNDTLLARVSQIGAACHTGNRSCFYRSALKKDTPARNPMKVFEDVYAIIEDRRIHPKEGSYTNYLFDKGIDKILKKCGEEAAEIIIAAKNPNPEEIKYEAADFLYHLMVLMSERGITWEDISQELANR